MLGQTSDFHDFFIVNSLKGLKQTIFTQVDRAGLLLIDIASSQGGQDFKMPIPNKESLSLEQTLYLKSSPLTSFCIIKQEQHSSISPTEHMYFNYPNNLSDYAQLPYLQAANPFYYGYPPMPYYAPWPQTMPCISRVQETPLHKDIPPNDSTFMSSSKSSQESEDKAQVRNERRLLRSLNRKSRVPKIIGKDTRKDATVKENRNALSNILRNFFKKINDDEKTHLLVKKIISKMQLDVTVDQFYRHVKKHRVDHTKYIRLRNVHQLFIDSHYVEYSLIFRIVFLNFFKSESLLQTLTSKKMRKESIKSHLEGIRELRDRLFEYS